MAVNWLQNRFLTNNELLDQVLFLRSVVQIQPYFIYRRKKIETLKHVASWSNGWERLDRMKALDVWMENIQ